MKAGLLDPLEVGILTRVSNRPYPSVRWRCTSIPESLEIALARPLQRDSKCIPFGQEVVITGHNTIGDESARIPRFNVFRQAKNRRRRSPMRAAF